MKKGLKTLIIYIYILYFHICTENNYVFGIISKNKTWAESMNCPDGLPPASFDNFVRKNSSNLTHGTYWSTSIKGSKTIPYNDKYLIQ